MEVENTAYKKLTIILLKEILKEFKDSMEEMHYNLNHAIKRNAIIKRIRL